MWLNPKINQPAKRPAGAIGDTTGYMISFRAKRCLVRSTYAFNDLVARWGGLFAFQCLKVLYQKKAS